MTGHHALGFVEEEVDFAAGFRRCPSSWTTSRSGSTQHSGSRTTRPFTLSRPARMASRAAVREAQPRRESTRSSVMEGFDFMPGAAGVLSFQFSVFSQKTEGPEELRKRAATERQCLNCMLRTEN